MWPAAFGEDRLVLLGSIAIALVNILKLPLVILPLRSLLLEQCGVPPLSMPVHVALTAAGVESKDTSGAPTVKVGFLMRSLSSWMMAGARRVANRRRGGWARGRLFAAPLWMHACAPALCPGHSF